MKRSTFFVMTIYDGCKRRSYALKVLNSRNLWMILEAINYKAKIDTLNACNTKSEAVATANEWNKVWEEKKCLWSNAPMFPWVVW